MKYIRFIVLTDHKDKLRCTGIVSWLDKLLQSSEIPSYYLDSASEIMDKFDADLPVPPFEEKKWDDNFVSWFKNSSSEWISLCREIVVLFSELDIVTDVLTTDKPGMIVYEDEWQVVAKSQLF
ncbi:MAG: hypothetical protein AAF558_00070 [Verrucomicrobiota bacterium]